MLIVTTYHFLAQAVVMATQQVWVQFITGLKSISASSTLSQSTKTPAPWQLADLSVLVTFRGRCTTLEKNSVRRSLSMSSFWPSPCQDHTERGSFIESGALSCVGLLGATLGGGVGPYGGLHGLQLDALLSVRMVTGTGALLNVSATSHPDLWWGVRGAGFNFGIVTSATYRVYDFTNNGQAMNADFRFRASQNATIYEFAASYVGKQPKNFYIDLGISYDETFGGVYHLLITSISANWHWLQTVITGNLIYVGPLEEGIALIQPLIDLGPLAQNITEIPWKDLEDSSRFGTGHLTCIKGGFHNVWGLNLYQLDVPTLIKAVDYMNNVFTQYPAFRRAFLAVDMFASGVTESVPDDATAYPYRNAVARLWVKSPLSDPFERWQRGGVGGETRKLTTPPNNTASSISASQTPPSRPPPRKSATAPAPSSSRPAAPAPPISKSTSTTPMATRDRWVGIQPASCHGSMRSRINTIRINYFRTITR